MKRRSHDHFRHPDLPSSNMASSHHHSSSSVDRPERSRNAKAQARHRAKRKAYIEQVRTTADTVFYVLTGAMYSSSRPSRSFSSPWACPASSYRFCPLRPSAFASWSKRMRASSKRTKSCDKRSQGKMGTAPMRCPVALGSPASRRPGIRAGDEVKTTWCVTASPTSWRLSDKRCTRFPPSTSEALWIA